MDTLSRGDHFDRCSYLKKTTPLGGISNVCFPKMGNVFLDQISRRTYSLSLFNPMGGDKCFAGVTG